VRRTDVIVIGGGQAGLAMSRCLSDLAIDHVVLERGRVAERWRTERWDSLRLLTPNWQSRLPGFRYDGPDPDGYMTCPEVVTYFERYAAASRAPVEACTTVLAAEPTSAGHRVTTNRGTWHAAHVVIATGYCDVPLIPAMASQLAPDIHQIVPSRYRHPDQLPGGGVLVVGASATGVQLADEIQASGRQVTLAVGRHTRLPRRYRGKDILWWMDAMGLFDATVGDVYDIEVSRDQPSLQLVGRPDHSSLDLALLQARGVRLAGRALAAAGTRVTFDDDLLASTVAADAKLASLLERIDRFAAGSRLVDRVSDPEPFDPCWPALAPPPASLDLRAERITSVVWATGFRRSYPWLKARVLDERGEIRHREGVTPAPGLHVLGLQFQRRRKSAFIDGVGDDAAFLAGHIARHLGASHRGAAWRDSGTHGSFTEFVPHDARNVASVPPLEKSDVRAH
jgi:putative flavoprotein involved in K+ transport